MPSIHTGHFWHEQMENTESLSEASGAYYVFSPCGGVVGLESKPSGIYTWCPLWENGYVTKHVHAQN